MKPWGNLGVVETIYEEEYEYSSNSPSLSPSVLSSPPTPLHSRVEAWSSAMGRKTDVLIHVHGTAFHLHKDPLSSRSTYLRRQLTEQSELTLSPPLNITAETFSLVAEFCYGTHLLVTPFNVASLLLASELLGMTETKGDGDQNLKQITEGYFRRFVAVNGEYAAIVFRSCLALLPEAETTAFLVSRCVEVMNSSEDGDGVDVYFDDVVSLHAEDFKIVAESMHQRFEYHDLLYRIVDFYLEEHNGKITEEQKTQICNSIDCNKLSPQLLLHAVQNPRMPLRFVVRAMLVEQLNTRRSIFSAANHYSSRPHRPARDNITLGAILQRDATMRETAQLKAAMDATSSRIQTLEKQLHCMKKILQDSDHNGGVGAGSRDVLGSGRSASFHYGSGNTIERADRGASSSASFRFSRPEDKAFGSSSSENSCVDSPRIKKNIGQRLIEGLKSALRVPNSSTKNGSAKKISSKGENGTLYFNQ
ncbi:BTB/POZ domain - like 3 [Theobroma cacao]|uniref:DNA-directed RNA polymerase II subunit RPB1 isoform 1 n=1 Tax=Theobroma cacao TaxID=3641 RepID=A0A061DH06_THECC|nr:DNA-directed RNA polymerase II subunit RPB1 isoform 1 [Theobroma cacao]EOX91680.1 DNA-directed RNA polymerase II subunit RPB1 isoform 1 [Theobroma cacao]WRX08202.1 BTB/POZ domain - like 3 [Theobroma cacao]